VKLMRALTQCEPLADLGSDMPKDSDGSAKVALIGTDRSIAAWAGLQQHFPEKADEILDFLLLLERIRKRTEKELPNARAFVRPGFDTEPSADTPGRRTDRPGR